MSNQCPADHPAVMGAFRPAPNGLRHHVPRSNSKSASAAGRSSAPSPAGRCCARCSLILVSMTQIALVLGIVGLPSVSPGATDLLRLARLDCSASSRSLSEQLAPAGNTSEWPLGSSTPKATRLAVEDDSTTGTPSPALGVPRAGDASGGIGSASSAPTPGSAAVPMPEPMGGSPTEPTLASSVVSSVDMGTRPDPESKAGSATTPSLGSEPDSTEVVAAPQAAAEAPLQLGGALLTAVAPASTPSLPTATQPYATGTSPSSPPLPPPDLALGLTEHHMPAATSSSSTPSSTGSTGKLSLPRAPVKQPRSPGSSGRPGANDAKLAVPAGSSTSAATETASLGNLGNLPSGSPPPHPPHPPHPPRPPPLFSSSGLGLLTKSTAGGAVQLLTNLQLDGQLDVDDMLLGILVACLALVVIAVFGLMITCSHPSSCARRLAATLYFVTSLPVVVALSFVVVYCFAFRAEAETLVRRYWLCLLLTEPTHKDGAAQTAWGAASAVYQSITLTASLLLACLGLLLAGVASAGHVIGWGVIAANLLNVINGGQLLVGGGLVAVAAGLHQRSDGSVHADVALLVLGTCVLLVSTIGLLGARLRSACLLRLYTLCSALVTLSLCVFVVGLGALGVQGLADSEFLAANWEYVRTVYPLSKEDFLRLLGRHWSKLMIATGLLTVVQLLVVTAAYVLRRAILPPRIERATASERAGLIADDDDDDGQDSDVQIV